VLRAGGTGRKCCGMPAEGLGEGLRSRHTIGEDAARTPEPRQVSIAQRIVHGASFALPQPPDKPLSDARLRECARYVKVALCTRNPDNPVIALLESALSRRGVTIDVIDDPRQVSPDGRWDVAYWRPDARNAQIAAFSRQAAILLDGLGTPFLNNLTSMDRAASKLVTQLLFERSGLAVPAFHVLPRTGGLRAARGLAGPVVVKPIWGKKAEGVAVYDTLDEASSYARPADDPMIVQRAIPWRHQYRCVVTRHGVVRVYRDDNPTPARPVIRSFDRFDARPVSCPDADLEAMAVNMLQAVGGDLMRADILEDRDGARWALEINGSFGFPHDDAPVIEAFMAEFQQLAGHGPRAV
jgi:glutathione synthase/RimK-type ligase-like ATP-grasp enzyme